jgi:hypothetical protein
MSRVWTNSLACLGILVVGSMPLAAQPPRPARPAAITDPAEAGRDYALQGEYAGWMQAECGWRYAGLQVVTLGEGRFEAVLYGGGLPGNGWNHQPPEKLAGQAVEGPLVLVGPTHRLQIQEGSAQVDDHAGRPIGRLEKVVRYSPTLGLAPPPGAIILFDGRSTDAFQAGAKMTPEGLLAAGALTRMPVGAFRLHLEFRTPLMPTARGQARGNSGVYIQRRYEVQILDSFGLQGAFNECGALYRQTPPLVNACLPPLAWQTYDIWFTPPVFASDGKTKLLNARITVLHNGVPVHVHREITAKTGGGQPEGPQPLPLLLQDHGNPVVFRNIWLVPGEGDEGAPSFAGSDPRRGLLRRIAFGRR